MKYKKISLESLRNFMCLNYASDKYFDKIISIAHE